MKHTVTTSDGIITLSVIEPKAAKPLAIIRWEGRFIQLDEILMKATMGAQSANIALGPDGAFWIRICDNSPEGPYFCLVPTAGNVYIEIPETVDCSIFSLMDKGQTFNLVSENGDYRTWSKLVKTK